MSDIIEWQCLNEPDCGHIFLAPDIDMKVPSIAMPETAWQWCPKCRASSRKLALPSIQLINKLKEENAKLREALTPFAAQGKPSSMGGWSDNDDKAVDVTVGQCRAAYKAVQG